MPANKPIGAFDETLNASTYTHATNLVAAAEFDDPLGLASYPYTAEMGLVGDWSMGFGGASSEFVTYASPHEKAYTPGNFDATYSVTPGAWASAGPFNYTNGSTGWTFEIIFEVEPTSPFILWRTAQTGGDNLVCFISNLNVDDGADSISISPALSAGNLYHAIVTYTHATGTWELWIDGVSQGTATATLTDDDTWGPRLNAGNTYATIRLYDRPLTSGEIAQQFAEPYAVVGASLGSAPFTGEVAMSAEGTMSVTGTVIVQGAVTMDAIASLAAEGTVRAQGAVQMDAEGDVAVNGVGGYFGEVQMDAVGSMEAAGTTTAQGAVQMDAEGLAEAAGTVTAPGAVQMDAEGSMEAASASAPRFGAVQMDAVGDMAVTGTTTKFGATVFAATGSMIVRFASAAAGLGRRLGQYLGQYFGDKDGPGPE